MDEFMEEFEYDAFTDPAKDIRLLRIDSQFHHKAYDYALFQFDPTINRAPIRYQALSYAWGDTSNKVLITLNRKRFYVTQNLNNALEHLHLSLPRDGGIYCFWIDAICIDQNNVPERDAQVRRMKTIYEQAEKVVIWLGKGFISNHEVHGMSPDDTIDLVRYLSCLHEILEMDWGNDSNLRNAFLGLATQEKICDDKKWASLAALFQSSWFERLWVIQELAASKYAYILWGGGGSMVPWTVIEGAAKYILRPDNCPPPERIRRLLPLMEAHRVTQVSLGSTYGLDRTNILTVLHQTQQAKCADPRDKLYGILGVVEDTNTTNMISVDYSLPIQGVYYRFAVSRLLQTRSLDVLGACANSSISGDLPSWVPDFRRPWGQDKQLWLSSNRKAYRRSALLRALGLNFEVMPSVVNNLHLTVNGSLCSRISALSDVGDVVSSLQDPASIRLKLFEILERWKRWTDQLNVESSLYLHFKDAVLRSGLETDFEEVARRDAEFELVYGQRRPEMETEKQTTNNFERDIFPRVHGCQLYHTLAGDIGIVAANCNAQVGDEIWYLVGGLTHFVLRPKAEGHQLISPCYQMRGLHSRSSHKVTLI